MTRFLNLWSFSGRAGRTQYFLVGVAAFLLKSNVDRAVATYGFQRHWGLLNYWFPFPSVAPPVMSNGFAARLGLTLLAISFPFIWLGLAQTLKRLRDIEQPLWLTVLFFVPFANVLFFAVLCLWPSAPDGTGQPARRDEPISFLMSLTDPAALRAALLAIGATTAIGIAFAALSTQYTATYGWGLFVALPVCLGMISSLIYSYSAPRTFSECLVISVVPVVLLALGLILFAFEGLICILMAAPIGLALSALGGVIGFWIQFGKWGLKGGPITMGVVLMIAPLTMGFDPQIASEPPVLVVSSSLEINAPPELVWQKVIAFSEISDEREWLFHTGIAYPVRATLQGEGVGAVRRCEFSTGAFVEPIQVWDEPNLLRFRVTENPAPMEELTPYHHIETPHLKGYFVSQQGQFELVRLTGNRTRLTGTTWYTDRVWPAAYWQLWSDYIIHRIHLRVLRHIQLEAENTQHATKASLSLQTGTGATR